MTPTLQELRAASVISALDEQLARTLCMIASERDARVELAIALVSRQLERGHVCLPLDALARGELLDETSIESATRSPWPALDAWLEALRASALVGGQGDHTPLVLDAKHRLYLRRYFEHEHALARAVRGRISADDLPVDLALLDAGLTRFFGLESAELDLQRSAARLAVMRPFCVISGGPGTGKTSTVLKILALCIEQAFLATGKAPRIHLMAPTGKAAGRMKETIVLRKAALACEDRVRVAIPEEASTIHRVLLQVQRTAAAERDGSEPKLATDLVLVDEASMVDLELMAQLFSIIPAQARVILLGDKHQLASVEAGAVLGDLCGSGVSERARRAAPVVHLTRSHRYGEDSGIGQLARAIQEGDADRALEVLESERLPDVSLCEEAPSHKALGSALQAEILRGYSDVLSENDPAVALARFDAFRVLCAHRRGARGAEQLNAQMLRLFVERGLVTTRAGHTLGAPILITQNDYRNGLWNGDVGIIACDPQRDAIEACFASSNSELRRLGVARLPAHAPAFAMSVHKSQGSELDAVLIVLPLGASRVLTRELLYTAVTRAKKRAVIFASRDQVKQAVDTTIARSTGLSELLYENSE